MKQKLNDRIASYTTWRKGVLLIAPLEILLIRQEGIEGSQVTFHYRLWLVIDLRSAVLFRSEHHQKPIAYPYIFETYHSC